MPDFIGDVSEHLREGLEDAVDYITMKASPLYALTWSKRKFRGGSKCNRKLFMGGHDSYGNYEMGGALRIPGRKGKGITMTQPWIPLAQTFGTSITLDDVAKKSSDKEVMYDELEAQLYTFFEDWRRYQIHDMYWDGSPYLVAGEAVQPIDGLGKAIGTGVYAGLDPDDVNVFPTDKAWYWKSKVVDLAGVTWNDLIDPTDDYFLLHVIEACMSYCTDGNQSPNLMVADSVMYSALREIARQDTTNFRNGHLKVTFPSGISLMWNVIYVLEVPVWKDKYLDTILKDSPGVFYGVNTNYLEWICAHGYDRKLEGPEEWRTMSDTRMYAVKSVQQFRTWDRSKHFKLVNTPKAIKGVHTVWI